MAASGGGIHSVYTLLLPSYVVLSGPIKIGLAQARGARLRENVGSREVRKQLTLWQGRRHEPESDTAVSMGDTDDQGFILVRVARKAAKAAPRWTRRTEPEPDSVSWRVRPWPRKPKEGRDPGTTAAAVSAVLTSQDHVSDN